MKLINLTISGFRGFNGEQTLDFEGDLIIYAGPNGAGKTSMGESLEWLLYGKTLKRTKGDEISKREYAESYRK
jgi:DNA repair exonuclease SbcCD ATPase subunit